MISKHYNWTDTNRINLFTSWEAEIAHAEAEGYKLAPPDYHIPHWTTAMSMGDALPKLYVMRGNGVLDELQTAFDRPVRDISYPLFFKVTSS